MKGRQKQTVFNNTNNLKKEANMYFEELNDIIENFCYSHGFDPHGESYFDHDEQGYKCCYSSFFYHLKNEAARNEKLTEFLIKLTKKSILNNKEKSIVSTLKTIESLLEKKDALSNLFYTLKSVKEREHLKAEYISLTEDIKHLTQELNSLIPFGLNSPSLAA